MPKRDLARAYLAGVSKGAAKRPFRSWGLGELEGSISRWDFTRELRNAPFDLSERSDGFAKGEPIGLAMPIRDGLDISLASD